MAISTSIAVAILSLWASSLSAARVRPTAKESSTSSLKSLGGEWFYDDGMSKYELIIDDNDSITFKSNSAEGSLRLLGAWWQGMLSNGIIRLQPDSKGNVVSQFKASQEDNWGDLITAVKDPPKAARTWQMVHDTSQGALDCRHLSGNDYGLGKNCPVYADAKACQAACLSAVTGCNGINFLPSRCCFKACEDPENPIFSTDSGYEVYIYRSAQGRKERQRRKQKVKVEKVANSSLFMNEPDDKQVTAAIAAKRWKQCPYKYRYDTEGDIMKGGEMSFECHKMSSGQGNKCPALQQARLKAVKKFGEATYNEYLTRAKTFPLKPLFDKTMKVSGSENYEQMVHMHVEGLMHKDVKYVEDKIMLKALATKLEIPATRMYFGAHKDDWDKAKFKRMLGDLCLKGVDEFIIKAVHLAWSAGQKIVRGWQKDCPWEDSTNKAVDELATFVDEEIMNALASEADAHLREFVTPGVTVEELFKTGGESKRPLEAKVQVVWGKVHHMFFVGDGPRGCKVYPGAWSILGDKTGWDLKGMIGAPGGSDEVSDAVLEHAFDGIVKHSESFAKEVGADVMRVDFFIGFGEDGSVTYKLNEAESVSGARYWHERDQIGRAWVDGYILSDRITMTPAKWDKFVEKAENARRENHLD